MKLQAPDEIWPLDTKHMGKRVCVYQCLGSTNTFTLQLSHRPNDNGLVVLARAQTIGRGQYGRSWHAPPGSSVLMSILLFPPPALRRPALLTAWAAVSVCNSIRKLANIQANIKWPNDVVILGKKVCGILIEQRTTGHTDFPLATVVGVGLNVTQSVEMFEQAGLPLAGSLASFSGIAFAYEDVAKELIRQMDEQYQFMLEGDFLTLEGSWKERLGLLGKEVIVEGVQQYYRGRLVDIALSGLDLAVEAGDLLRLLPEAIRHIEIAD